MAGHAVRQSSVAPRQRLTASFFGRCTVRRKSCVTHGGRPVKSPSVVRVLGHSVTQRVLVVDCGGLGGIVRAHLAELGAEVTAVSRNAEVASSVSQYGFRLCGATSQRSVAGRVVPEVPDETFDLVILATQPTDVETAARQVAPVLGENGVVVVLQNGLCEERVARVLGDRDRVIGAVVAWGGRMLEPGLYDRTSSGGMTVGGLGDVSNDALTMVETTHPWGLLSGLIYSAPDGASLSLTAPCPRSVHSMAPI